MPVVRVKEKFQLTLPVEVRRQAGIGVGDLLEATVQGKKITLTPKSLIDRELALALEDVRKGRVHGPFDTAEELVASLRRGRRKARHAKSA